MVMDETKEHKSKSNEKNHAAVKSVQSLPDEAFEGSSRSSKRRFRKKGSPKADDKGQGKSPSDVTKRKKSLGQHCRSFLSRLFRSKSRDHSPLSQTKNQTAQCPSEESPFRKSLISSSTQSVKLKQKPSIDVVTASPNNSFQIKSHQSCEEIRSNSFSNQSPTSSVKSGSSPRAIINISPSLKVVAITPTDDGNPSLTTARHTSNDCVVLNFTQTEVPANPVNLKSVQSSLSGGESLKVTSSSDQQKAPSPSSNKLKSSGYCVTVTPNNNSAYALDYESTMHKNLSLKNAAIIQRTGPEFSQGSVGNHVDVADVQTNLTGLHVRPTDTTASHKQPISASFSDKIPAPFQRNKFSQEQNFSEQLLRGRQAIQQDKLNGILPKPKLNENPDVLDEILNNAMKQLIGEGGTNSEKNEQSKYSFVTGVNVAPSVEVNRGSENSKDMLLSDQVKCTSQQECASNDLGSSNYQTFFSKDPLILYSRAAGGVQKVGDAGTLSPDSGVSSIQSPASESLKGSSSTQAIIQNKTTHESPNVVFLPSGSSALDFNVRHQNISNNQSTYFPAMTFDSRQTPQHFVFPDKKLVNVVTPTTFVDSQTPIAAPRHTSGRTSNNSFEPLTIDTNPEYKRTMSSGQNVDSAKFPSNQMKISRETTQSFPKVPPPSYKSIIEEGDPVDLARFKGQPSSGVTFALDDKSKTPLHIRRDENIYDMIPAAAAAATGSLLTEEGIYEQIPFHKMNVGSTKIGRVTIEPKVEHIEFSLKPILPSVPKPNQSSAVQRQNGSSDSYFPTIVKPPMRDFRINEALQQELKEKLRGIGVEDRYQRIKEEYLGMGSPSQTSYKPHHPQTFAPVQVVQEPFDNLGKDYFSEDEIRQKRLHSEKIMDLERQKKALRERLDLQSRRHADQHRSSVRSPTSGEMARNELLYDNIEPPRSKKITKYRGRAKALYNFKAQKARELSLRRGDIVYLLRRIDRNWFEGEHHGMTGIFPISYVEVLESIEEVQSIARMREGSAAVLHDFYPRSPFELALKKGYVVTLIKRLDDNWYEGRCGNSQGIFPAAYVSTIREPDTPLPTPCATPVPTPSPSRMHTPLPGAQPGWQSPSASSIFSLNPDIPVAPKSPTMLSVDFSRESTPFGGSVIGAPTYFPHRPSSVMSEPVRVRDCRTLPHNFTKPLPKTAGPTLFDNRHPLRNLPMQENVYDNKDFSDCFSDCGWMDRSRMENLREFQSPYKNFQAPVTFASLNQKSHNNNNDPKTIRKKPVKLSFAPIPEKDTEVEMIKPIIYPRYIALHSFDPRSPEELKLEKNEIVRVVEKCRDGWYIGFLESTRQFGLFPGNFVEALRA